MKLTFILVTALLITILVMVILTYLKVKQLSTGSCEGVPTFDPNSTYSKSLTIPLINKTISGTATFKTDNTFTLTFDTNDVYTGNTWTYDKANCQINVALNSDLANVITKYDCSISTDVKIDKQGNLVVSGTILGVLPIEVVLVRN